ncbi:tail fiber protein [Metasolibacillus sp.]|uniref:phage tail protein n=1 Tax=Metasolibacillus sp. TaxID=2703680 RepID=UPI0025EABD38|nr:tail fiber protein [Metasolibacillus sp.]MCT6923030.1 tail fiber protein [Metasolibacillus sp.]MCT6939268.1 tail fiber protein [Metasolibacillus sp.]
MSESYVGEIRMFAGNYAPKDWALCNGQLLSIAENEILFALIGTTYGGDGQTTFGLPDLRGRVPIHINPQYSLGAVGGTETVTLTTSQMPNHTHIAQATTAVGNTASPDNMLWATTSGYSNYSNDKDGAGHPLTPVAMNANASSSVGGNQPHNNMMPTVAISFIISLYGVFPSQQ